MKKTVAILVTIQVSNTTILKNQNFLLVIHKNRP